MRHFLPLGAEATLAFGMGKAAATALLVAATCGLQRGLACLLGTTGVAVDVAPVTVAAQDHLAVTTGALVQASGELHRPLVPMSAGVRRALGGYWSGRARHSTGGVASMTGQVDLAMSRPSQRPSRFTPDPRRCHLKFQRSQNPDAINQPFPVRRVDARLESHLHGWCVAADAHRAAAPAP